MKHLYRYQFGAVVYDESRAELRVDGKAVRLQRLTRKLLSFLLATPRTIFGRDELLDKVWGYNSETKDHALTAAVERLRRVLGPDGTFLKTVHGKGYQFDVMPTREVVGSEYVPKLDLQAGADVPSRPGFRMSELLSRAAHCEVWLTLNRGTGERRACKFSADPDGLREIRWEARLLLHATRALSDDCALVGLLSTHFESPPFFIEMAYGGENLAQWIQGTGWFNGASQADRITLFLQIADAAAALHTAALVHADLKPRNILVTHDELGGRVVRIIDFGSGHLLASRPRDQTGTLQESLAVAEPGADPTRGTFMYLAPELWSGSKPNVQSDVFSLGILLYQLVIGNLSGRPESGWQRGVTDPLLASDIRRAIDGDPRERFGSVGELARSLRRLEQRHEEERQARSAELEAQRLERESAALRLRQSRAQARRPAIVAAFAFLAAGLVAVSVLLLQARQRNAELALQKRTSDLLNQFLDVDLLGSADPAIVGQAGLSVADAATRAAPLIETKYASEPARARAPLHMDMQRTLSSLTRYAESMQEGQLALAALEREPSPSPAKLMEIHLHLAASYRELSKSAESRREFELADRYRVEGGLQQTTLGATYWRERANMEAYAYQLPQAMQLIAQARRVVDTSPAIDIAVREQVLLTYSDINKMAGHFDVSEATLRSLRSEQIRRLGVGHPQTCRTASALGMVLGYEDKVQEGLALARDAQQCLEQRLGKADLRTAVALDLLAGLYFQAEDWNQAAAAWKDELARTEAVLGSSSTRIINVRSNVARCLRHTSRFAEAEAVMREAMRAAATRMKPEDAPYQSMRFELADILMSQNKTTEVRGLLSGLSPQVLASVVVAPDWQARLDYAQGRLDLLNKDYSRALAELTSSQNRLLKVGGDDRLPAALLQRLVDEASHGTNKV